MGMGGQHRAPGTIPTSNDPVHIVQEALWAPGPDWKSAKISNLPEFEPRTAQPVA